MKASWTLMLSSTLWPVTETDTAGCPRLSVSLYVCVAPCGLRGCKNGPAPFPGRMLYNATKPGLVSVLYLSMFFIVLVFIRAPFYVLLVFIVCVLSFGCSS